MDGLGDLECRCVRGFGGDYCQHHVNECASYPCQNDALCHDYVDSYTCACQPGFSGVNCQVNDNDCTAS